MVNYIKNLKIHYTFHNINADTTIVLLHGWGQNIEMMMPVGSLYHSFYNVLILDLPGFGESDEPESAWTVYEYASFLKELVDSLSLKKIILMGHSFGGKIALVYASKYPVEKLVCFASPYCKEMKKLPLKTKIYKCLKKVFFLKWIANIMKHYIGSSDYKKASEKMRGVLVQSVNLDISEDVKKISCPVLLIWGSMDTAVPVKRAYELEKLIPDAGVVLYEGNSHYAYLERLQDVKSVLDHFFQVRR